jgi:hypothetical protein
METELKPAIDQREALEMIGDGHMLYSQEGADKVCAALGVARLIGRPYFSDPPGTVKGLLMHTEGAIGVSALELGYHVCRCLDIKARECLGRGSQGRALAEAIAAHLGVAR